MSDKNTFKYLLPTFPRTSPHKLLLCQRHTHTCTRAHPRTYTGTHIHTWSHINAEDHNLLPAITKHQNQHHQSNGPTARGRPPMIDRKRERETGKELKNQRAMNTNAHTRTSTHTSTHIHRHTHSHIHLHLHLIMNAHQSKGPRLTGCNHKTPKKTPNTLKKCFHGLPPKMGHVPKRPA